jgi:hypothetical protein
VKFSGLVNLKKEKKKKKEEIIAYAKDRVAGKVIIYSPEES